MALLEILKFPDPRLRTKAQPITTFDAKLEKIAEDMFETMYHANGVGLAGTQVNIHQRIFTMDVSPKQNEKYIVINPEIVSFDDEIMLEDEGCLSVIGAYDKIKRAVRVHMRGLDVHGKPIELHAEGLMAKCIQHEIDHLNGMLFIDHLSKLKQNRIRTKILKEQKRG